MSATSTGTRLAARPGAAALDVAAIQADFPILLERPYGKRLVYLDNANTTQKPRAVLDAQTSFCAHDYANVHRATHQLSERANRAYDVARERVRAFIHAPSIQEIVFTRGCTDSLNLVAHSLGRLRLRAGDEVLVTWMEHHSNIVPWQLACAASGASLKVVPIFDDGTLDMGAYRRAFSDKTKIVSAIHVSNALGTINPVRDMVEIAHEQGVPIVIDGAQAVAHLPVDVQSIDCDFYAFSSHKMYGPTGVGVLYGKRRWLDEMPPYQGGGDMISSVTFEHTTYNELPFKFEAGTPNIVGVVGLGAAVAYLEQFDRAQVAAHEQDLLTYATAALSAVAGVRLIGTAAEKSGVVSFLLDDVHPHDIGTIVDREGVAIRTGQHCAQPLMDRYGVPATARASFAIYNTRADVDALVQALVKVRELFG